MRRILPLLPAGLAVLLFAPLPGAAQSFLSAGGLGIPVEALDARTRGLGSPGIGLFGSYLLPGDPAAAAGLRIPTISASMQPARTSIDLDGASGRSSSSRFPLLAIGYPVGSSTVATLTFGSYLDQRWNAEAQQTVDLVGEEVEVTDSFDSDGGVSSIRLGLAHRLTEQFAVGIAGGVYTGRLERTFTRSFDDLGSGETLAPFVTSGRWRMRAPTLVAGAQWDFQEFFRLAGSMTWAGALEVSRLDSESEEVRDVDLPIDYRLGASAILTPRLSFSAALGYSDWSNAADALGEDSSAGTVWTFGGGAEWEGPSLLGRDFPIRVGYRRSDLPFRFGESEPSESLVSGGFGINFSQIENIPLARLDVSVERGNREAGMLSESFWRSTISIRLSGG